MELTLGIGPRGFFLQKNNYFHFAIDNVKYHPYVWCMETLQPLKVDRSKLITQSQYAKKKKISRQRVNQMIKSGLIVTVEIEGAILVYQD